jgi:hypothetical protein
MDPVTLKIFKSLALVYSMPLSSGDCVPIEENQIMAFENGISSSVRL